VMLDRSVFEKHRELCARMATIRAHPHRGKPAQQGI